jgi:hypothetical protein
MQNTKPGRVVVRGASLLRPPLLDSAEPKLIEFYGDDNRLIAFFARLMDNTWGFCTEGDEDWTEMLIRYGFSTLQNVPIQRVIAEGVEPFVKG